LIAAGPNPLIFKVLAKCSTFLLDCEAQSELRQ